MFPCCFVVVLFSFFREKKSTSFFVVVDKVGSVKQPSFCFIQQPTRGFVSHAFHLLMCAYNVLCLCDCLPIVCEAESPHLLIEDCFL